MALIRRRTARTLTAGGVSVVTALAVLGTSVSAVAADGPAAGRAGSDVPRGGPVTEAVTAEQALVAAQAGEREVEILDRRTETSTTWANPDGTLTTRQAAGPIRMIRDGKWVDVDVDFTRDADGSVRSKAHPEGLRLAGPGGTKARSARAAADAPASAARDLISLGDGDQQLALQWKGGLPAPVLDGPRATYPSAVPGADLVVDATRTGFEQYLVVNERPADGAAPMTLPLRVTGLKATAEKDGSVSFTDKETGEKTATLPAPVMWDAKTDERSGEHVNQRRVPMEVVQQGDSVELRLTPDADFLSDPGTRYPVTIDPATNKLAVLFDTFVQGGDTTDQSASTDLKLGWPGDHSGTTKRTARSFMTWDTEQFADALVSDAKLRLYNYHSWSCAARGWEVWASDGASTATRWTNQPALKEKIATSTETRSASCNNAGYVSADVTRLAQIWSSAKATKGHVALKAASETDTYAWKRFQSSEAAENQIPELEVTYNYRPNNGTNLQAGAPFIANGGVYRVNSLTPTLRATVNDTNEDDRIRTTFEIKDQATGQVVHTQNAPDVPAGSTAKIQVAAGKLVNGKTYTFRTTTFDGDHYANGWSAPVTFTVDTGWRLTPAEQSLGAVNGVLEASDLAAATTSSSKYAAIAHTDSSVAVPWTGDGTISVTPDDGRSGVQLGLPGVESRGVNLNDSVVYSDAARPVDTVVQPTLEGGTKTMYVIKNANGSREQRTPVTLPAGAVAEKNEDGEVVVYREAGEDAEIIGTFSAPWARDANGKAVPTSYRLEGNTLVQSLAFDSTTAFPVVADPWWNPWSWNWKKIGKKLKSCRTGAWQFVNADALGKTYTSNSKTIARKLAQYGLRAKNVSPKGFLIAGAAGCVTGALRNWK